VNRRILFRGVRGKILIFHQNDGGGRESWWPAETVRKSKALQKTRRTGSKTSAEERPALFSSGPMGSRADHEGRVELVHLIVLWTPYMIKRWIFKFHRDHLMYINDKIRTKDIAILVELLGLGCS
jgi:hypothetical protein